jgi:hypothetical protein
MQPQDESLRHQIALGWIMELLLMVIMLEFMTIASIIEDNNFKNLRMDPGEAIHWMVYLVAIFALMPIYVHLVHGVRTRIFRWIAFALAILIFLYFLLHHLAHWAAGQRPDAASWARLRPATT